MTRQFYVYIMTNRDHHCSVLVLYEVYLDSYNAIAREKQISRDLVRTRLS
jgi:predicted GIY-YIG superfamily endonuclease